VDQEDLERCPCKPADCSYVKFSACFIICGRHHSMEHMHWVAITGYGNETFAQSSPTDNILHISLMELNEFPSHQKVICPHSVTILSLNWGQNGDKKGQISIPDNLYVFCHFPSHYYTSNKYFISLGGGAYNKQVRPYHLYIWWTCRNVPDKFPVSIGKISLMIAASTRATTTTATTTINNWNQP